MCFSAEASFVASAALGLAGGVAIKNVKEPSFAMLACIPFIFSVQQFSEGLLWLSFTNTNFLEWRQHFVYAFLFFALVVWPVWIPFSTWQSEINPNRKKILFFLLLIGFIVAGIVAYGLLFYPVQAEIRQHHIHYILDFKQVMIGPRIIFYFTPAVLPPLLATNFKVKIFGLSLLGSYLFARFNYPMSVISVWCYFAAIISLIIIWIVSAIPKATITALK